MGEGSQGFESVEVTRLRREIESAWGAFDDIDQMSWDHRVLVVRYVVGALPDAASTAARAGHSGLALRLLADAAEFPPPWASICTGWQEALAASVAAVECRPAPLWLDDESAGSAAAHSIA
ncbi:hypothetical protein [Frigoribacterium faeni]|uniref:hypothetical protein n=1 Tax=Frigoribacterium faeni TaxID=145483 RepID=UPI00141B295A|nr:hypothetical protein [Frigoribacterium faeni]NIJ06193.1 hypothetical protein [Frigoribacterium faeni]